MEAMPELAKQTARRKSKPNDPKKKPQRGMGVEKLERIRIVDEIRKKNTSRITSHNHPFNLTNNQFSDPSVQNLHLAKLGSYGASQTGLNEASVLHRLGTAGIYHQVDPYGFVPSGSTSNATVEINSCKLQKCGICFKKKRINGGNLISNADTNQPNSFTLSGFDVRNFNTVMNHDLVRNRQETEIVAVHRKGNQIGGNNVVMEYEFFPGGKVMKMEEKSSSSVYGDQAAGYYNPNHYTRKTKRATKTPFASATDCIDLDLKLSY